MPAMLFARTTQEHRGHGPLLQGQDATRMPEPG